MSQLQSAGLADGRPALLSGRAPLTIALRWFAGIYFLLLGASLLVLPQGGLGLWLGSTWLRGAATFASGLLLLWLLVLEPPRPTQIALYLVAALPHLISGVEYLRAGTLTPAVTLLLLAAGVIAAPLLPAQPAGGARRPDALGLVLGAALLFQGLDILLRPAAAATVATALGFTPAQIGLLFATGGLLVVVTQLATGLPELALKAAHGFAGSLVLAQWVALSATIAPIYWVLGAAVVLRGLTLVALPWWTPRAARFDPQALRVRLALALITAALVPLMAVLTMVLRAVEQVEADLTMVRQLAYALTIGAAACAGAGGWWLAGRLASPISMLMLAVGRIAAGERGVRLQTTGPTELAHLSEAVGTMAATLDARLVEREALTVRLQAQNDELRHHEELREESIRALTHDLRNPLTALLGNAQRLERLLTRASLEREARVAHTVAATGQRMNGMIQDLADALRVDAGSVELRRVAVDLPTLVRELSAQLGDPDQVVRIELTADEALPPVAADPGQLDRVISNLLSNALKYSPPASTVVVGIRRAGGEVLVTVRDRGIGMTPAEQAQLFRRYYRAEGARALASGLGLGLYVSRALVEAHGGRLWVESAPGVGSTFSFTLPLAEAALAPAP